MFARLRAAVDALFDQPAPSAPLGSVRPLPESVKDLARRRPAFQQRRLPSPFPLVDSSGMTWAERRRLAEDKNSG